MYYTVAQMSASYTAMQMTTCGATWCHFLISSLNIKGELKHSCNIPYT